MSWVRGPISQLGPPQSLPSFSEFVTGLGQDAIPTALHKLRNVRTSDGGLGNVAWTLEQTAQPTSNADEVNAGTAHSSLITPVSTPDHLSRVDFVQRPSLKRPYRDDAELVLEAAPHVAAGDQHSPSKIVKTSSPCVFEGFVPFKKQRKDRNQPLNPLYTRDGSPRKRLAQACERCRTQKIKCRLEGLTCAQCVKQGLKCEFKILRHKRRTKGRQREIQASQQPHTHSTDEVASQISAKVKNLSSGEGLVEDSILKVVTTGISESNERPLSPLAAGSSVDYSQLAQIVARPAHAKPTEARQRPAPAPVEDLCIDIDPILFDANLTRHYCDLYFTHIDRPPHRLLPRAAFLQWLNTIDKNTNERMLLYAVLAAGAIFSQDRSHDIRRIMFTQIAEDALHACQSWFELPVIHTLLVLASVNAFSGAAEDARAHSIAAMRCCYGMQLNNEPVLLPGHKGLGYVGTPQIAECGRRTFWLAHIKTVLWGSCLRVAGDSPGLQGSLRLPCDDAVYETGTIPESPAFKFPLLDDASRTLSELRVSPSSSPMSLMIHATLALGSSTRFANATSSLDLPHYNHAASWTATSRDLHRHLKILHQRIKSLPSSKSSALELFLAPACIELAFHRRVPADLLPPAQVTYHYRQARWHAARLLETLDDLWQDSSATSTSFDASEVDHGNDNDNVRGWNYTQPALDPIICTAVFSAFDVLTSAGLLSSALDPRQRSDDGRLTLRALATLAITVVSDLAGYSRLAEMQLGPMKKRLAALLTRCNAAHGGKRAFRFAEPLELLGGDVVDRNRDGKGELGYRMPRDMVLGALGVERGGEDELLEMV